MLVKEATGIFWNNQFLTMAVDAPDPIIGETLNKWIALEAEKSL